MVDFWASIAAAFIVCLNFTTHYLFSEQPETIASSTETSFFGVDMRASVIIKFLFKSTLLQDTNNFKPHTQEKKNMFVNCKTKKIQSFLFGKMHHQQRHRESAKEHDCFFVELLYYITLLVYYPPYFCRKIIQEQFFEAHIFMKISRKFPPSSHKCKKIELTFSNNHKDRYSPTRHSFVFCP